jgi:dihydrofolate reductase
MADIVLFIATSLDGYIAGPNGEIDWLETMPNPDQSDHGYGKLMERTGTFVMGSGTYKEVLGFGVDWPYPDNDTLVMSSDPDLKISTPRTFLHPASDLEYFRKLKTTEAKDIWLVGGGKLLQAFLKADLVDEMIITLIPTLLGDGIRLFPGPVPRSDWDLVDVERFASQAVGLTYRKRRAEESRP